MQKSLIFFAIVLSLLYTTVSAQDESEYERLHRESDIERQAMVAENFPLLDSEAEAFWDLYLEYRVADREMDDQRVELLRYVEEADNVFTHAVLYSSRHRLWQRCGTRTENTGRSCCRQSQCDE